MAAMSHLLLLLATAITAHWSETRYDAGCIDEAAGVLHHAYWLRNDGEYGIKVQHVYTSCGCTTAEWDADQLVRHGDSIQLMLHFDPHGRSGAQRETATVHVTDGEETQQYTIELLCDVRQSEQSIRQQYPIDLGQGRRLATDVIDLGELSKGQRREAHVAYWADGAKHDTVLVFDSQLHDEWGPVYQRHQIMGHEVTLWGIVVPAARAAQTGILSAPSRVMLGALKAGQVVTQEVKVQNTGNGALTIYKVYRAPSPTPATGGESDEVEVLTKTPITIAPHGAASISVRVRHTDRLNTQLFLITDDPNHLRAAIRLKSE